MSRFHTILFKIGTCPDAQCVTRGVKTLVSRIYSSIFVRGFFYCWELLYCFFRGHVFLNKGYMSQSSQFYIKSVALIYSKVHDPRSRDDVNPLFHNSIAYVLRMLSRLFPEASYYFIEMNEKLENMPHVDLVVGLLSKNYIECALANKGAKKVLFLVNSHPLYRNRALIFEAIRYGVRIPISEWADPITLSIAAELSDVALLIGNDVTKMSFSGYTGGLPICTLNLGVDRPFFLFDGYKDYDHKIRIIYPASSKGLRKGLFRVFDIWRQLNEIVGPDQIELVMIGKDEPLYVDDIKRFCVTFGNVINIGWADSNQLKEKMNESHIVLAPALEEGQVGAVLEAMACGNVPIVSRQCGISLSCGINGWVENYWDTQKFALHIKSLVDDRVLLRKMSECARQEVLLAHDWSVIEKECSDIINHSL